MNRQSLVFRHFSHHNLSYAWYWRELTWLEYVYCGVLIREER